MAGLGIIPARAGFTTLQVVLLQTRRDHPRSRGVYPSPGRLSMRARGSSPLARGLPSRRVRANRAKDHPRSRGVYLGRSQIGWAEDGSSPLARGLLLPRLESCTQTGIIPARAGFTKLTVTRTGSGTDHPRSRGVYEDGLHDEDLKDGSSPLARGLRLAAPGESALKGIIPARAGFTRFYRPGYDQGPDHPRSRGVYRLRCMPMRLCSGSSPLARGLLPKPFGGKRFDGIIPARAGFT